MTGETLGHQVAISADIGGATKLYLVATPGPDGNSCDWCDWLEPKLVGDDSQSSLMDLHWQQAIAGWGSVQQNKNCQGQPLQVGGKSFETGIGTHAPSVIEFDLPANHKFTRFTAIAGLDAGGTNQRNPPVSSVQFLVFTQRPPARYWSSGDDGGVDFDPIASLSRFDIHPGNVGPNYLPAEPMLTNPTNIDIDERGRVWVCEAVNYRNQVHDPDMPQIKYGDRIVVFEDTDGDGRADRETTFYRGHDIDSPHGICVLGNRVLVSVGDHIYSFVDTDGDLHADRKDVLFSGIGGIQHDHGIHACVFGPDGKLYFNFGNEGQQSRDARGKPIVDLSGHPVEMQRPYQNGMVFRCDLGRQRISRRWPGISATTGRSASTRSDDYGNRTTTTTETAPRGSITSWHSAIMATVATDDGSGWQTRRTNLETDIPSRHWHLNDPGVVPNLLITGAGSPTRHLVLRR